MKQVYATLLLLTLATAIGACRKNTLVRSDYIIVGYSGGYTPAGAHTKYYRVANGELRKDTSQRYQYPPADISMFNFNILMPPDNYAKVADLPASIPAEVLKRNNSSIGNSMAHVDGGYHDVRATINGTSYKWRLEGDMKGESKKIRQFAERIGKDFP